MTGESFSLCHTRAFFIVILGLLSTCHPPIVFFTVILGLYFFFGHTRAPTRVSILIMHQYYNGSLDQVQG